MITLSKPTNPRVAEILQSLSDMSFPDVEQIVVACEERMQKLRETGVTDLAEQFESMAAETFGMTVKQIMAATRKRKRQLEATLETASDNDDK